MTNQNSIRKKIQGISGYIRGNNPKKTVRKHGNNINRNKLANKYLEKSKSQKTSVQFNRQAISYSMLEFISSPC